LTAAHWGPARLWDRVVASRSRCLRRSSAARSVSPVAVPRVPVRTRRRGIPNSVATTSRGTSRPAPPRPRRESARPSREHGEKREHQARARDRRGDGSEGVAAPAQGGAHPHARPGADRDAGDPRLGLGAEEHDRQGRGRSYERGRTHRGRRLLVRLPVPRRAQRPRGHLRLRRGIGRPQGRHRRGHGVLGRAFARRDTRQ